MYELIHAPALSGATQDTITKSLVQVVTGARGVSGIYAARMVTIDVKSLNP